MCAVLTNVKIMETDVDSCPWRDEYVTVLPDTPGWGTELDEAALAARPWQGNIPFLASGGRENRQGHALTPGTALCKIAFPNRGALAQLGERHNGIVEVMGSSPISSIRIRRRIGTGL